MKRFLIRVWPYDAEYSACSEAYVELDDAWLVRLSAYRHEWRRIKEMEPDFCELRFTDWAPKFVDDDETDMGKFPSEVLKLDFNDCVVHDIGDVTMPEFKEANVSYCRLVVSQDGIQWYAGFKHVEGPYVTVTIEWKDLFDE